MPEFVERFFGARLRSASACGWSRAATARLCAHRARARARSRDDRLTSVRRLGPPQDRTAR